MTNPAGPEQPLADATALSRLCQGSLSPRRAPSSPPCLLTSEGMPAARSPPLLLEQSSVGRQRFPFSADFANVALAQAAPVTFMQSINANINRGAEKQAWPLPLLQRARVQVHPKKAHGLDRAFMA